MTGRQRLAGLAFIAPPVVFLVAQLVAQARWTATGGYSWSANDISDLGNVTCGTWDGRAVCSPGHAVMNVGSVATTGLLLVALTASRQWWWSAARAGAWCCQPIGSIGFALAGLFPADRALAMHLAGTGVAAGTVSLAALLCLVVKPDLGLGPGGMERVVVYPVMARLTAVDVWAWRHDERASGATRAG